MPLEVGHLQFAFLFLSVPIQYFIVQQSGSSESHRTHQISVFIKQIKDFYQRWFRVESWVKWLRDLLDGKLKTVSKDKELLCHSESLAKINFSYNLNDNEKGFKNGKRKSSLKIFTWNQLTWQWSDKKTRKFH